MGNDGILTVWKKDNEFDEIFLVRYKVGPYVKQFNYEKEKKNIQNMNKTKIVAFYVDNKNPL